MKNGPFLYDDGGGNSFFDKVKKFIVGLIGGAFFGGILVFIGFCLTMSGIAILGIPLIIFGLFFFSSRTFYRSWAD